MNALRQVLLVPILVVPLVLLGFFGVIEFLDGWAVDGAVPVPNYMIARRPVSPEVYRRAASALADANKSNGQAAIERAEAMLLSGADPASQIPVLTQGLSHQPASARGWLLLSEAETRRDTNGAALALGQALSLAPYDFWLVEPRAQQAALIWDSLDTETRSEALQQVRLTWEEPALRPQLRVLLETPQGVGLVAQAFAGKREEMRSVNRWLERDRQQH